MSPNRSVFPVGYDIVGIQLRNQHLIFVKGNILHVHGFR
jgi:hypothetical protein